MINLIYLYNNLRISYHKFMAQRLIKRVDSELERRIKESKPQPLEFIDEQGKVIPFKDYIRLGYNQQLLYKVVPERIKGTGLTPLDEWHNNGAD